jgi:hypothetical protein
MVYWINRKTGEFSWVDPNFTGEEEETTSDRPTDKNSWNQATDLETGKTYWKNPKTGEFRWDKVRLFLFSFRTGPAFSRDLM